MRKQIKELVELINNNPDSDRAKRAKIELDALNILENRKRARLQMGLNCIMALFTITNVIIGILSFQMKKGEQHASSQQKDNLNKMEEMERRFDERLYEMQSRLDSITIKTTELTSIGK